ncbi:Uncharacterised protein [Vibrio cholerae]|nr:Uncharacterised protein [Vibrio cholerae]
MAAYCSHQTFSFAVSLHTRSMFQWSLTKAPKSRMSSGISKVAGKAVGT